MSKQVIDQLTKNGWEFRIGFAMPVTEYKSPRLKNFYYFIGEEFTIEQIKKHEIENILIERAKLMEDLFAEIKLKCVREWEIILKKELPLPDEVTLDFKFNGIL